MIWSGTATHQKLCLMLTQCDYAKSNASIIGPGQERGCGVVGAGWRLGLHVVEIVDEIVIWDKFVFNGLTFLVDHRVGVHSHWRLGSCQH